MTSNYADIITLIIALGSFGVASATLYYLLKFRSELALSEQIANIPDFLRKEYLERCFPPRVTKQFEWLHTLKDARFATEKKYKPLQKENYKDAINRFQAATLNSNADFWERYFAYELSLALEQVGMMVLAGAIPLKIVLAMNAPQIVEDWGYCSNFVNEKIRKKKPLKPKESDGKTRIKIHRWHGEWLVYAAAIYMDRYWTGRLLDDLISVVCDGDMQTIRKREEELWEELTKPEYSIVPKNTKQEIEKLLGTDC